MVIRVEAMPDYLDLPDFDDVFRAVLGWDGLGFICRVHGQEFNSFRRRTQSKTLRDFHLRPREEFLYTCGAIDLWEWEFRLLDRETGMPAMTRRSVWVAGVRLPRSTAAVPSGIV